jgi:hypothetical protein
MGREQTLKQEKSSEQHSGRVEKNSEQHSGRVEKHSEQHSGRVEKHSEQHSDRVEKHSFTSEKKDVMIVRIAQDGTSSPRAVP